MIRRHAVAVLSAALFLCSAAYARAQEAVFGPGEHCIAYRTVKDIFFDVAAEVIGRSCEVSASVVTQERGGEARIVVSVPVASLKSGNIMRNHAVADLLGADVQPDLRFTSETLDAAAVHADFERGHFVLPGVLSIGGKDHSVVFPLRLVEQDGRRAVTGRLETTFEAFAVEVPTVVFGLIARPHEGLELLVQLQLERVAGFEAWFSR